MINSRKDYEHNINVLAENMRAKKVHFNYEDRHTIKKLLNVRQAPNGRVNFQTADETARSLANSMVSAMNIFEKKKIFKKNE